MTWKSECEKEFKFTWKQKLILLAYIVMGLLMTAYLTGCSTTQVAEEKFADCRQETSPMPPPCPTCNAFGTDTWNYCFTKGSGKYTVVYLHGYLDSEHAWQRGKMASYMKSMSQVQDQLKDSAPDVIAISYSKGNSLTSWLLSPLPYRSDYPQLARLEHFTTVALPLIEDRYSIKGNPRVLWGMSMGGANASVLCMKNPSLWKACVIQHPMVNTCDNWNFIKTCPSAPLVRANFMNQEEYNGYDPFKVALTTAGALLPPMFLSVGKKDDATVVKGNFDLYTPGKKFGEVLKLTGANVTYHEDAGGHAEFEAKPIADFIKAHTK